MSLKSKVVGGATWNLVGKMADYVFRFTIGVVIARLLSPAEYGIVGLANIFITLSYIFVDSGFTYALIQKQDCSERDYSTVFYFNILVSFSLFILIWLLSPVIAHFFKEPKLISVIRALILVILIQALYIVQVAKLKKGMAFKQLAQAQVIANFLSGIIALFLAYKGFGVWALVTKSLCLQLLLLLIYTLRIKWKPLLVFDKLSFKKLFSFGSKHLIGGILNSIYLQLKSIIVAKFYSPSEYGVYSRAESFQSMTTTQIAATITEVTFPLFSGIQDNLETLKKSLSKIIRIVLLIVMPLSILLMIIAKPMVMFLLGNKWSGVIKYLELLYIYGAIYPIAPVLLNSINAIGRSDLVLKLEIIRKTLDIPILFLGALISIQMMIIGIIVNHSISTVLCLITTKRTINYSIKDFLMDFKVPVIISAILLCILLIINNYIHNHLSNILICFILGFTTIGIMFIMCKIFNIKEIYELYNLFLAKMKYGTKLLKNKFI